MYIADFTESRHFEDILNSVFLLERTVKIAAAILVKTELQIHIFGKNPKRRNETCQPERYAWAIDNTIS